MLTAIRVSPNKLKLSILEQYFLAGAPSSNDLTGLIPDLLNTLGYEKTYSFLMQFKFTNKNIWINAIWLCIPQELISEDQVAPLLKYIELEGTNPNPVIPKLSDLMKFQKIDGLIVQKASKLVAKLSKTNKNIVHPFLLGTQSNPEELVKIFSNDIGILETMYFSSKIDYNGRILMEIIKLDPSFWDTYINQIKVENYNNKNIFKQIWILDNYKELFDKVFTNVIFPTYNIYFIFEKYEVFFPISKEHNLKRDRNIKKWVLNFIKDNANIYDKIGKIFSIFVEHQTEEDRYDYIEEFLKYNKSYDEFKKLSLIPTSRSWSGSSVPIFDEDISFLENLMSQDFLEGLDYLDYKKGISERIKVMRTERENLLIKEYQDDYLN